MVSVRSGCRVGSRSRFRVKGRGRLGLAEMIGLGLRLGIEVGLVFGMTLQLLQNYLLYDFLYPKQLHFHHEMGNIGVTLKTQEVHM